MYLLKIILGDTEQSRTAIDRDVTKKMHSFQPQIFFYKILRTAQGNLDVALQCLT